MAVQWSYTPPAVNAALVMAAVKEVAEDAGAQHLLAASQPLVPVDSGDLKASGHVERDGLGAAVVYDVVATDGYPYGIRQHEDMALNHPNGGQAKFLEAPMHSEAEAIAAILAAEARKALGA